MDEFFFYTGFYQKEKPKKVTFLAKDRSKIFSDLVSNLKKSKGEISSLDVAKKTWIECLSTPIQIEKSDYSLYNMKANQGVFDKKANVKYPNLLASWFYYDQKDKRLNNLSGNKPLLVGIDYNNDYNDPYLEKDYFLDTTSIFGKKYYVYIKVHH